MWQSRGSRWASWLSLRKIAAMRRKEEGDGEDTNDKCAARRRSVAWAIPRILQNRERISWMDDIISLKPVYATAHHPRLANIQRVLRTQISALQ